MIIHSISSGKIDANEKLKEVNRVVKELGADQPNVQAGFMKLLTSSESDGKLPTKVKELISLALAINVKCEWCIAYHMNNCLKAGATKDEIMETASVAILMGGAPSLMYLNPVLDAFEQLGGDQQQ